MSVALWILAKSKIRVQNKRGRGARVMHPPPQKTKKQTKNNQGEKSVRNNKKRKGP